ncbi:hypothetical protein [Mycobacterium sp.]|uniref:hypothetical protein n=1 Tax=Mycobacterium sp. TaxID=1785 RepID=UPI0031E11561
MEQTSPGVLGADQALLTTATDLSNAGRAFDADPSSLTAQLDLLVIDVNQVFPVEVDEALTSLAAAIAGHFDIPVP